MNFVINSSRAPIGRRPIQHWSLKQLLREFGVATIEPPRPRQAVVLTELAKQAGRTVRTLSLWRSGRIPRKKRDSIQAMEICRNSGLLKSRVLGKRKKYCLWDLWDMVKARWKELSRKLHPDVSRRHYREFATMSLIHDTIRLRFQAKGIA